MKTGDTSDLIYTLVIPLKLRDCIRPICNSYLRSVPDIPVQFIGNIKLFNHLWDLEVRVNFGVVHSLAVPLHYGTSFIERVVKVFFAMKRSFIAIPSCLVALISECTLLCDPLRSLQADWTPVSKHNTFKTTRIGNHLFKWQTAAQSKKYKSVCINYDKFRWTHLPGAISGSM